MPLLIPWSLLAFARQQSDQQSARSHRFSKICALLHATAHAASFLIYRVDMIERESNKLVKSARHGQSGCVPARVVRRAASRHLPHTYY